MNWISYTEALQRVSTASTQKELSAIEQKVKRLNQKYPLADVVFGTWIHSRNKVRQLADEASNSTEDKDWSAEFKIVSGALYRLEGALSVFLSLDEGIPKLPCIKERKLSAAQKKALKKMRAGRKYTVQSLKSSHATMACLLRAGKVVLESGKWRKLSQ